LQTAAGAPSRSPRYDTVHLRATAALCDCFLSGLSRRYPRGFILHRDIKIEKEINKKLFIKVLTALRTVNRMRPTSDDNRVVED
jgi:hypothetical protein